MDFGGQCQSYDVEKHYFPAIEDLAINFIILFLKLNLWCNHYLGTIIIWAQSHVDKEFKQSITMQKSKTIIQSIHPYKRMYFEFYYNF